MGNRSRKSDAGGAVEQQIFGARRRTLAMAHERHRASGSCENQQRTRLKSRTTGGAPREKNKRKTDGARSLALASPTEQRPRHKRCLRENSGGALGRRPSGGALREEKETKQIGGGVKPLARGGVPAGKHGRGKRSKWRRFGRKQMRGNPSDSTD
jgi:hypothetical protein